MRTTVSTLVCCIFITNCLFGNSSIGYLSALDIAQQQQKNIFVNFEADWCLPCQLLKEGALADSRVQATLSEDFISQEVDIDNSTQSDWLDALSSSCLPTMYVLSDQGDILKEISGNISSNELLDILNAYATKETIIASTATFPPSISTESKVSVTEEPVIVKESVAIEEPKVVIPSKKVSKPIVKEKAMMNNIPVIKKVPSHTEKIVTYTIAMGAFSVYENAVNQMNKLNDTYGYDIRLSSSGDSKLHKLSMGSYSHPSECQALLQELKSNKVDHYLRKNK